MDFRSAVIYFCVCIMGGVGCALALILVSRFGMPERSKNLLARAVRKSG